MVYRKGERGNGSSARTRKMNGIFEQIRKWLVLAVVIFVVLSLFLFVKNIQKSAAYKVEKKNTEEKVKAGEARISDLEKSEAKHKAEAEKNKKVANEEAAKREADNKASEKKLKEQNEAWQKKVAAMTADAVVEDTRARLKLGEADIYKNSFGIQFSLVGAKVNLLRIADADSFTLDREPQYKLNEASFKRQIANLTKSNEDKDGAIADCDGTKTENIKIKAEKDGLLKKSEAQVRWLKISIPVAGTAVVVTLIYIALKLIPKK